MILKSRTLAVSIAVSAMTAFSPVAPSAQTLSLEGTWNGGGHVRFPSGDTERARCRATFHRRGGNSFDMSATCATASVRVQQTAVLERIGPNRFAGEFYNAEYGISGSIAITLKGQSLAASLNGAGASAHFNLGR
jgi:hypothetical protein